MEDLGVDGRTIMGIWTEFKNLSDQGHGHVAGCFGKCN